MIMIFLSYVKEDRERVLPFYDLLSSHGHDPWMDCKKIIGGQDWDYEIRRALDRSEIVVVFISNNSIDKRGYAQREIKLAIDKYEERLTGDIYIIPIQLEPGDFPHLLRSIQFIKASEGDVEEELLRSIEVASHKASEKIEAAQSEAEVRWSVIESKSSYSGIPGYSTTVSRLNVTSSRYSNIREISDHVNGELAGIAMKARESSLTPDPKNYNLMQHDWRRTDTFDAIFMSAQVIGRVISITYSMHWYNAGAAHPVHSPKIFNYLLEPVFYLQHVKELFGNDAVIEVLKSDVRSALAQELCFAENDLENTDWIRRGTENWDDFSNFSFSSKGMIFQFPSYQVACYAAGMPTALVSYERLVPYFRDSILYALDLHRPYN